MIKITNVTKTYNPGRQDETTPLKNFHMEVSDGETVILSGPSGSGKSTVLHMIAGLIKPTEGLIEVQGKAVSKLPEHFAAKFRRENIGMIFQKFHLIGNMSTAENVALPLLPSALSHRRIKEKTDSLLSSMGIADRAGTHAEKLSGGEMQRAAIARALINDPKIILADEPTANLDKKLSDSFIDMIKELRRDGRTLVIATHDPALINSGIADRVIEMTKAE